MSLSSFSERISEALIRATGRREHRVPLHPPMAKPAGGSTVAVSRQVGTPDSQIAHAVAARLRWPAYDHELLERIASEMHVAIDALEHVDERHIPWLQECVERFGVASSVSEEMFVARLVETVQALGAAGESVIVGRGAAFVLLHSRTLSVRLIAPPADRAAAVGRERRLASHAAAALVEKIDRERAAFVRRHFLRDVSDPQNYDLVLNTAQFDVGECADLIIDALARKLHLPAPEAALFETETVFMTA